MLKIKIVTLYIIVELHVLSLLGKDSFEKKSCENPIFFSIYDPKNIMCKLRKILPWKPKIVRKKSIFSWKLSKFSKYIGQGVPLPPSKKFF